MEGSGRRGTDGRGRSTYDRRLSAERAVGSPSGRERRALRFSSLPAPRSRAARNVVKACNVLRGPRPTGWRSERQGTYACSADFICATGIAASTTIGDVGFHIDAHSATQGLARLTNALARATNFAAAALHTTGATVVRAVRRRDALIIATGCVSRTTGQITAPIAYSGHICRSQKVSATDPCF
jgi:hypothetical protein